ncbi:MAG: DUF2334 domain-containing protein [Armatimonadota bacterium]
MKACFTNDDAGSVPNVKSVEHSLTVVEWLDRLGIKGTFFWVPKPGAFERAHEVWDEAVREVRDRGHDFQLHGLTHASCLEFGVPQPSTRRANPSPFEEYESDPERWEREHTVERLLDKIREGCAIYQRVFDDTPTVFRAPCFGVCSAMYEALAQAGITASSSRGINPTATAYTILGDPSLRRWAPDFPCKPWVEPPGVTEYPCTEDLLIRGVPNDAYEDRLDLLVSELGHVLDELGDDGLLVFGSHYHSMMSTWDRTRPLLEEVFEFLADRGVTQWVTFRQHIEQRL